MSRVILWTAPCCLSTAFELSVRELEGVEVVHEPHSLAFWSEVTGIHYTTTETFEDARRIMLEMKPRDEYEHIFIAETAHYLSGRNYIQ